MDIVQRMSGLAELGPRWVLWLLFGLSVVALAIIVERLVLFLSSRDDVTRLRDELRSLLEAGDERGARRRLESSPSFEARVAAAGLAGAGSGADERMQGEQEVARLTLERRLAVLGTLGNNAPFLGLLGTVIGIVRAFRELEQAGSQVSAGLMAEIGEALIATAVGLLVALPAVAAFNAFHRVVRERIGQSEVLRREVLSYLRRAPVGAEAA